MRSVLVKAVGDQLLELNKPKDHVGVALARPAHGLQTVDDGRLDVDEALAALTLYRPHRCAPGQSRDDGFIGGGRDGDADRPIISIHRVSPGKARPRHALVR